MRKGSPGTFEVIGQSLVSAQQLFLGNTDSVYFIDKVENNPTQINGHPVWGSEWGLSNNQQRPLDVMTNAFCAGGNVLGNGTWINVGGNQAVTWGGNAADRQDGGGPYNDPDGRQSIRMLDPCGDRNCDWRMSPHPSDQRWYPTLETVEDGSIMIIGGCRNGGYVNDPGQDNPTYEFFPSTGDPIASPILSRTLPVNLYPLVWLLPSGRILMQANWETVLLDRHTNQETQLDDIPDAVRVYPASAGTLMLPLTPANNYTATVLFCGGANVATDTYVYLVLSFLLVEDVVLTASNTGTAGYGNTTWAVEQSFADNPLLTPILYNPKAPAGSVMVSGSNPNADYTTGVKFSTEYRTELFYPSYFSKRRPEPKALPVKLTYGGAAFDVQLSSDDLFGNIDNINKTTAVVIRPGFSTHSMNMGQRYVELQTSFTGYQNDHTAILHVSQLPPNPAILVPGPALLFIVVDGVPSVGVQVMVGSGNIETQQMLPAANLPASQILMGDSPSSKTGATTVNGALGSGSRGGLGWAVLVLSVAVGVLVV
ncbi:hypothetical protein EST38_g12519 [Candolleomyces aberdarensis]|uniref:Copper radical oxidase n=1 Tax=Candolleomyces aberdarensis TaxID=2316362 RepID=A0A4Q2D472_9AGAR|nr:hypothetical protein EST38_g12519 [Candolleomyces aberdarensis]